MAVVMGYADRRSLRAGETIAIKVSAEGVESYTAEVVRLIAPDVGPPPHAYPYRADPVDSPANGPHPARVQPLVLGSYVEGVTADAFAGRAPFTVTLRLLPTLLSGGPRVLVSTLDGGRAAGVEIALDDDGTLLVEAAGPDGPTRWRSALSCPTDGWSALAIAIDPADGRVAASVTGLPGHRLDPAAVASDEGRLAGPLRLAPGSLRLAAGRDADGNPAGVFNGRLERPRWLAGWSDEAERLALCRLAPDRAAPRPAVADWDFARAIDSERAVDVSGNGHDGVLHNMPARGVTGSLWDTGEIDWRANPAHYGAIHFPDHDLIDAGWENDFTVTAGADWPSGCYAVRLSAGEAEFFVPFFVRPPAGQRQADAVFLVPTCTYSAYANLTVRITGQWNELIHGRLTVLDETDLLLLSHPGLGKSTYDNHTDGSIVLYSSLDRPVTNFRPKGRIYKFCQDMLIIAWAEAAGFDLDILTDEDLHREGGAALAGYRTVLTGSHPEYWSTPMLDALEGWLRQGGRLMYLGGNGFFWRTAYHPDRPSAVEVRRTGMERIWAGGAGEQVFSSVPEPGGSWSRVGRPPQMIAGVGYITQGFDASAPYFRRPDADNPRAAFILEGVPDRVIGDFGILMGGAAGYEIDRYDRKLGSPAHALVLASSGGHSNLFDLMVGSIVDILPSTDPDAPDPLRADMVFFETPGGGAVFSVGSIAWSGSLGWNAGDNPIARITANVLTRFNDPAPFAMS
ncbi:MAG: hypothetical protein RLO50_04300 [Azospirillaceae bacterium]